MCDVHLPYGKRPGALLALAGCLLAVGSARCAAAPSGGHAGLPALVATLERSDPADESQAQRKATRAALREARALLAGAAAADLRRRFYLAAVSQDIADRDFDHGVSDLEALVPLTSDAERAKTQQQLEEMKVVRDLSHQATLAQNAHNEAKAASTLHRIVTDHPRFVSPDLLKMLVGIYQRTRQGGRAVAALEKAVRLYKGKLAGRLALGSLASEYRTQSQPERAVALFEELLRFPGGDEWAWPAHFGLAQCYVAMAKKPEALRELDLAKQALAGLKYDTPEQEERARRVVGRALARVEAQTRALK